MPRNQMTKNEKASATDKAGVALYQEKQVVFEGAIPHPYILKGYGEIDKYCRSNSNLHCCHSTGCSFCYC